MTSFRPSPPPFLKRCDISARPITNLSIKWSLNAQTHCISTALEEKTTQRPACLLHEASKCTWSCRLGRPHHHRCWEGLPPAYCTLICAFGQVFFIHMYSMISEGSWSWLHALCCSPAFPSPAVARAMCRAVAAWGAHCCTSSDGVHACTQYGDQHLLCWEKPS